MVRPFVVPSPPPKPGARRTGHNPSLSCTLEDVSGQQQNVTRQGAPWWLSAALAAADQAEANAGDLTPEERGQLANAARRIYAAALPPGTTPDDVRRQEEAIAAAIFAGGNVAGAVARSRKLQGMSAIVAAIVAGHAAATIPPKPQP